MREMQRSGPEGRPRAEMRRFGVSRTLATAGKSTMSASRWAASGSAQPAGVLRPGTARSVASGEAMATPRSAVSAPDIRHRHRSNDGSHGWFGGAGAPAEAAAVAASRAGRGPRPAVPRLRVPSLRPAAAGRAAVAATGRHRAARPVGTRAFAPADPARGLEVPVGRRLRKARSAARPGGLLTAGATHHGGQAPSAPHWSSSGGTHIVLHAEAGGVTRGRASDPSHRPRAPPEAPPTSPVSLASRHGIRGTNSSGGRQGLPWWLLHPPTGADDPATVGARGSRHRREAELAAKQRAHREETVRPSRSTAVQRAQPAALPLTAPVRASDLLKDVESMRAAWLPTTSASGRQGKSGAFDRKGSPDQAQTHAGEAAPDSWTHDQLLALLAQQAETQTRLAAQLERQAQEQHSMQEQLRGLLSPSTNDSSDPTQSSAAHGPAKNDDRAGVSGVSPAEMARTISQSIPAAQDRGVDDLLAWAAELPD